MFTTIHAKEMSAYPLGSDIAMLKAVGVVVAAITGVAEIVGGRLTEPKVKVPIFCQPLLTAAWSVTFPKMTLAPVKDEEKLISTESEIP